MIKHDGVNKRFVTAKYKSGPEQQENQQKGALE